MNQCLLPPQHQSTTIWLLRRSDNDDTTTIWLLHEALKRYPNDDDDTMMMWLYCDDGDDLFDASAASRQWLCTLHMTTMIRQWHGDDWLLHGTIQMTTMIRRWSMIRLASAPSRQWLCALHMTTMIRRRYGYGDDWLLHKQRSMLHKCSPGGDTTGENATFYCIIRHTNTVDCCGIMLSKQLERRRPPIEKQPQEKYTIIQYL